jgi:hypothetical protein
MSRSIGLVIIVVVVALVAGAIGYGVGANRKTSSPAPSTLQTQLPSTKVGPDSLITTQEATAVGKITKADSNSITMQSDDNKVTGFKLGSKVNIYPASASSSAAVKVSNDPKSIVLNKKYQVHLFMVNGEFVATTIQALQ